MKTEHGKRRSLAGTTYWMAPEIILKQNHNFKVDIWSLGIIAIEILEKHPPYFTQDLSVFDLLLLIATNGQPSLKTPDNCSDVFKGFIAS